MDNGDIWTKTLLSSALSMDVALTPQHVDLLLNYSSQLQRWNRVYNLTAVKDPHKILVQHILDSLSVVAPLRRAIEARPSEGGRERIRLVDVGSGAGLPGVVLAVTNPDWDVFCVDAVGKKMAFVRQMRGALRVANLNAIHSRIESLPAMQADILVSRAFSNLAQFVDMAGKHLAPRGWAVAMKGQEPQEEVAQFAADGHWCVDRIQPLQVPGLEASRCLVWMSPRQGTV